MGELAWSKKTRLPPGVGEVSVQGSTTERGNRKSVPYTRELFLHWHLLWSGLFRPAYKYCFWLLSNIVHGL